ncbi:MAG TPA: NUDIX domain-containing protein [Terriglobia bacterium]|nr:NUDIX domain-containing protein [Terriglobia bacterium]
METSVIRYPRVGVGGLLLRDDQALLLLRRLPPEEGCWSLPGGRVEFMERIEDALKRELQEELGIDVAVESLLCVTNHIIPSEETHWVSPAYRVRLLSGEPRNLEPEKTAAVQWFSLFTLPENLTMTARAALNAARAK